MRYILEKICYLSNEVLNIHEGLRAAKLAAFKLSLYSETKPKKLWILRIVAWALVHCNVCVDSHNLNWVKETIFKIWSLWLNKNKISILPSNFEEKCLNFKFKTFDMFQICGFTATFSQKFIYLIQHYAITDFGWTQLW